MAGSRARRRAALVAFALTAAASVAGVALFLWPDAPPARQATFPLAELEVGAPRFFRPFDMGISDGNERYGLWLVRQDDGEVLAFFSREPHRRRCAVRVYDFGDSDGPQFVGGPVPSTTCPTSRWAFDGTRLGGPGPRDLDRFDTTVEDGVVRIDMSRLRLGDCSRGIEYRGGCPYSTQDRPQYEEIFWRAPPP